MAERIGHIASQGTPIAGRIVYEPYTPTVLGVIVSETPAPKGARRLFVLVRWLKTGQTERESADNLADYESLVVETERKARNHRAAFEKAKAKAATK